MCIASKNETFCQIGVFKHRGSENCIGGASLRVRDGRGGGGSPYMLLTSPLWHVLVGRLACFEVCWKVRSETEASLR